MSVKSGALSRIVYLAREPLKVGSTVLVTVASYYLALGLRFDFDPQEVFNSSRALFPLLLLALFRVAAYLYWNLHSGYWRHSSTRDLRNIVLAHSVSTVVLAAAILLFRIQGFPRSVLFIEYFISIIFAGGLRFFTRMICEEFLVGVKNGSPRENNQVVVLGAGNSAHLFIKTLFSFKRLGISPVAVLDDDERLQGFLVHGVKVTGKLNDLPKVLSENPNVGAVILAIPTLSSSRLRELEALCAPFKVSVKRVQAFEDIALRDAMNLDGPASIEAILERPIISQFENEVRAQLKGKRVLVTGGGGSIGSELVRQIITFGPARVTILDSSEYNLYRADLEFSKLNPEVQKRFVVANINDLSRMHRIFAEEKPEYVFHAAAYKHVPLMESNGGEAFKTNVIGTWNVLECSARNSVGRFVLISTDKAVDPSSIMGCTKRLAEWLVQEFSNGVGEGGRATLNAAVVRFGNVINSTGSVIPLFREQILSGGPITVTHPDIERFFMSIQEAARLVLTAGTLGKKGEVYVLDMGKKLKIVEVAQKMLALHGRPDIPIVFTGLRPGEKLTEDLLGQFEDTEPTEFVKVSRVHSPAVPGNIARVIREFEATLHERSDLETGQRLHKIIAEGIDEIGNRISRETRKVAE